MRSKPNNGEMLSWARLVEIANAESCPEIDVTHPIMRAIRAGSISLDNVPSSSEPNFFRFSCPRAVSFALAIVAIASAVACVYSSIRLMAVLEFVHALPLL
jgi:hypothetical protein